MFEDFTPEDRELAEKVLQRAAENAVLGAADQADLIEQIFGQRP